VRAKIHQRIRERVPLLPEIVAHLERELAQARALREAAAKAAASPAAPSPSPTAATRRSAT
jgi:hypothetical protein